MEYQHIVLTESKKGKQGNIIGMNTSVEDKNGNRKRCKEKGTEKVILSLVMYFFSS